MYSHWVIGTIGTNMEDMEVEEIKMKEFGLRPARRWAALQIKGLKVDWTQKNPILARHNDFIPGQNTYSFYFHIISWVFVSNWVL